MYYIVSTDFYPVPVIYWVILFHFYLHPAKLQVALLFLVIYYCYSCNQWWLSDFIWEQKSLSGNGGVKILDILKKFCF